MVSDELNAAAANLAARFKMLAAPTRVITSAEWDSAADYVHVTPEWLKEVLGTFPLADGVLEQQDPRTRTLKVFGFVTPELLTRYLEPGTDYARVTQHGFTPIGHAEDGNVWLAEGGDERASVYHFDNSEWDGVTRPSRSNGLTFAGSRLAFVILSMAVSEASYYSTDRPRRVMWYPD